MGQMYLQRFVYGEGASTAASRTTSRTALDGVATP